MAVTGTIAAVAIGAGVAIDSSEKQKTAMKNAQRESRRADKRQNKLEKERQDRIQNEQTLEAAKILRLRQGGSSVARAGASRQTVLGVPGGGRRTLLGE